VPVSSASPFGLETARSALASDYGEFNRATVILTNNNSG
jgi:hypothetical protein